MASIVSGLVEQVQVLVDGQSVNHAIASTAYGYCTISAATPAKTVEMSGFTLINGVTIQVKFDETNTATNPTLNVQETGAFPIMLYGSTPVGTTVGAGAWTDNEIVSLTYIEVDSTHKYWYLNKGNTKTIQSAVTSPTTGNTPTLDFIATISQDANGVISATKQTISTASTSTYGVLGIDDSNSSETFPLYYDSGLLKTCNQFAGGTQLTLNGTSKASNTASIYAPTSYGNLGEVLISGSSSSQAPTWSGVAKILENCLNIYPLKTIANSNSVNTYWSILNLVASTTDSTKTWTVGNTNGVLYITKNGTFDNTYGQLKADSGYWSVYNKLGVNGENSSYQFYVNGTSNLTGNIVIGDSLATGNIRFVDSNVFDWTDDSDTDSTRLRFTANKDITVNNNIAFKFSIAGSNRIYTDLLTIASIGDVTIANNATIAGIVTADSASLGNITIGTGTDKNIIATISSKPLIIKPAGDLILYQPVSNSIPTARVRLSGTDFRPEATKVMSLGTNSQRWLKIYAEDLIVIGGTDTAGQNINRALRIYNASNYFTDIVSQAPMDKKFYLPAYNSTGDMYAVHTGGNTAVGSTAQPVYIAANGRATVSYPIQYADWSITTANDDYVDLASDFFTTNTYVIEIVVTSGEHNLNGPITWTSSAGHLVLSTEAVSGAVSGYVITAIGQDITSSITATSAQTITT